MKVNCLCIDDKNRPKQIPPQKWIMEDIQYSIIHVGTSIGSKIPTCTLQEVKLDESCKPYDGFRLDRFAFTDEGIKQLIELMKACAELNDFNIDELVEECNLEKIKEL